MNPLSYPDPTTPHPHERTHMRTIGMTLALVLGFVGVTHGAEDMDTTLDRAVTLAEARAADKATTQPTDKRPASAKPGSGANAVDVAGVETATCVDGKTYYHPTGEHRGACAKHGGVASWADGSPVKSRGGRKASYR